MTSMPSAASPETTTRQRSSRLRHVPCSSASTNGCATSRPPSKCEGPRNGRAHATVARGMTDINPDLEGLVAGSHNGVLVTLRKDGRPQLSNIIYGYADATARISVTDTRAKTRNLRRDPRASLYVTSPDFWTWVVADGTAELAPPAADPHDATVEGLVAYYR